MAIGIQPTGWTNDDFQEIGNDTPYQVILDQTKQTGYEGGVRGITIQRICPRCFIPSAAGPADCQHLVRDDLYHRCRF